LEKGFSPHFRLRWCHLRWKLLKECEVLTDSELVERVLAGEKAEYAELVRRHEQPVRATALSIVGNWHTAQDVVQEAFVRAYQKLGQLHDKAQFGSWVTVIARRLAIDASMARRPAVRLDEAANVSAVHNDGNLDIDGEQLLGSIMKLKEADRQAIMLRYFGDLNFREISTITGRSIGTISKQVSRAHQRLRKLLKEYENG
jgi:RNA polymerase sigma-70 factor, ECF subfamily